MSRKITHEPQTFPMNFQETSSVKEMDLGSKAVSDNGEVFRYVKAGATALVAGTLLQSPAIVADDQNIAVAAAASVGDKEITVTLGSSAVVADQYAGGVVIINDAAGEGYTYRVASHPAADAAASLVLTLEDEILEALTTSSEACLIAGIYNGVIISPTTQTGTPVGVAVTDIPAGEYGWIQTRGVIGALNQGGTAVGLGLAASGTTAGALATVAATTTQIATAYQAGVSTEYRAVFLELE